MLRQELNQIFDYLVELHPRFHDSEAVKDLWYEALGRRYHKGQVIKAIRQFTKVSEKVPSLAGIQGALDQVYGAKFGVSPEALDRSRKSYRRIDACMDALGAGFVNRELGILVGEDSRLNIAALVARTDWIPAYRAKLDEMWQCVVNYHPHALKGIEVSRWE